MHTLHDGLTLALLGDAAGGSYLDASGHDRHIPYSAAMAPVADGFTMGPAMGFTDVSFGLALNTTALGVAAGARSVALWLFTPQNHTTLRTVYNAGGATHNRFGLDVDDGVFILRYGDEAATIPAAYAGAWRFVALTYDGDVLRFAMDDALLHEAAIGRIYVTQENHQLGGVSHMLANTGHCWEGMLARMRVYDRALTSLELRLLLREPAPPRAFLRWDHTTAPAHGHRLATHGFGATSPQRNEFAGGLSNGARGTWACGEGGLLRRQHACSGSALLRRCGPPLGRETAVASPAPLGVVRRPRHGVALQPFGVSRRLRNAVELAGSGMIRRVRAPLNLGGRSAIRACSTLAVADLPARYPASTLRVLLDDKDLSHAALRCVVSMGLFERHDTVEIEFVHTPALWATCDPALRPGVGRLQVTVDDGAGVTRRFLLEERAMQRGRLVTRGRACSALAEVEYAATAQASGAGRPLASQAAAVLLAGCGVPLRWGAHDWPLPETWRFAGAPLDGVAELAAAVGAVVRSDPQSDGVAIVPSATAPPPREHASPGRHPVRLDLADHDTLSLAVREITPSGVERGSNAVVVHGGGGEVRPPTLSVDPPPEGEIGLRRGAPATVRAFWPDRRSQTATVWTSHGEARSQGEALLWRRRVRCAFIDGVALLTEPPVLLGATRWLSAPAGAVRLSPGRKELLCAPGGRGLCLVDYAVRSERFLMTGHDAEAVLFVLTLASSDRSAARVVLGDGPVKTRPEAVESPLCMDHAGAVARGVAELAWRVSPRLDGSLTSAHVAGALGLQPGELIRLDHVARQAGGVVHHQRTTTPLHDVDGLRGACMLQKLRLECDGVTIRNHMELTQWRR